MQPTFTSIREARRWASLFLQQHQREPRVADLLLEHFLNWTPSQLLAFDNEPMPEEMKRDFVQSVRQHAATGVPVQHLTGVGHFYGREFQVNENVLIPRPETEELVLGVMEYVRGKNLNAPKIVDLGTGSGVIAITLAAELPGSDVRGVDLSEEALRIAQKNATQHGADVQFYQGDFLEPLVEESFDVIVSNPPYIAYSEKEQMADTVVDFDPGLALFAEEEGLAAYKTILTQVTHMKQKPKCIAFEIGQEQGESVTALFDALLPELFTEVRQDINGKDRMVFAFSR
ncbi:peptide chain release factor N(5)-glutamine methyltransferase [Halobacillus sp. Nhm2S1]|uniref:peptide chain release factor N(5)-glutamine methyltransferase n=1 Tax=Halobacillus sp. Nhm2S1 TaxID=2866716 RepID=UPI001C73B1BF|nr:peptide chain release factor N(5)-glutamine methyltransferase [Halobacillus sp. Nhm2S1]MBX0357880.1 peptide chain release factor N(5)-glutamine methyltransferase [Halobacillus sp. Nhm2S1]